MIVDPIHQIRIFKQNRKYCLWALSFCTLVAVNFFFESVASAKRQVHLDLQKVEGSVATEIELQNALDGSVKIYRTESNLWQEKLDSGIYALRTRSIDDRGVAGVWSSSEQITVQLDSPIMNSITGADSFQCASPFHCEFEISWAPIDQSEDFEVQVYQGGLLVRTETTSKSMVKLDLPSNRNYQFSIKALNKKVPHLSSTSPLSKDIRFVGTSLPKPKIQKPIDDLINEVQWEASEGATQYDYEVARKETGAWTIIFAARASTSTSAPIDPTWPGGRYKINVRAAADSATSSEWSEQAFYLRNTDRSPPLVESLRLKQALELPTLYYLNASYKLAYFQYSSDIYENQSHSTFSSFGSNLAIGTSFVPSAHWSANTNLGLGLLKISGQSFTPISWDLAANFRHDIRTKTQLLYGVGVFYSELPVVQAQTSHNASVDKISVAGPRVLLQAAHIFSSRWAAHLAFSADYDLSKVGGPGGSISPTTSTQVDANAHYWINYRLLSIFGIYRKSQSVQYQSSSSTSSNRISEDDSGLNFKFNWSF